MLSLALAVLCTPAHAQVRVPAAAPAARFTGLNLPASPAAGLELDLAPELLSSRALAANVFDGQGIPKDAIEATRSLKAHLADVRGARGRLPREAAGYHYLLAPGYFYDLLPSYFQPNLERLRELGLSAEIVRYDPLGDPAKNARSLARSVVAAPKPVVVIGHSKGGLDAMEMLERFPAARARVAKLVAIQSPFYGSPLADWILSLPRLIYDATVLYIRALHPLAFWRTSPFFGTDTLRPLSRAARAAFPRLRPGAWGGVDLYSVASWASAASLGRASFLGAGAFVGQAMASGANDGLVGVEDSVLPGSRYAVLEEIGHLDPVSDPAHWKHRALRLAAGETFAAELTEAIVRWIHAGTP